METAPMGRVMTEATIENLQDLWDAKDVMEVPDSVPALIGQLPLGHLDFVVDLRTRTLIGNPAHGGEHMYELY